MKKKKLSKNKAAARKGRGKHGITRKLTSAIVVTIAIMVAVLLTVVYNRVSDTLL